MPKEEKGKYSVLQRGRKNNEDENYKQELPNERRGKEEKRRKQRKSKQKQAGIGEDRSRYPPRSDQHF